MQRTARALLPVLGPPALLLAAGLIAFGGSLWHGFAAVDDEFVVVKNLAIRGISWENIKTVFSSFDPEIYIPVTFVSFQINYLLDGLNPATFHVGNVLLHAVNAYLLYQLLLLIFPTRGFTSLPCTVAKRLVRGASRGSTSPPAGPPEVEPRPTGGEVSTINFEALFGALVFAAHPLFAQSVVWITGRKDLLCMTFLLLSFLFHLRYRTPAPSRLHLSHPTCPPRGEASPTEVRPHLPRFSLAHPYALSLLFFLLALLSKPTAMMLPAVLILYDVLLAKRSLRQSLNAQKLPYIALAVMFAVVTIMGKERLLTLPLILDATLLGSKSVITYVQHFLIPMGFSFFYPFRGDVAITNPALFLPLLLVTVLVIASIICSKKCPKVCFGLLTFLIILSPTFLNLQTGGFTFFAADRFAYIPGIGLIVALTAAIDSSIASEAKPLRPVGLLRLSLATIILFFLILASQAETRYWKDPKALFTRALELYPESVSARIALANLERQDRKYSRAFEILKEGLAYGDDMNLRVAAGIVYANTGNVQDAIEQFEIARQMAPQNPEPLFSLGAVYEQTGRSGEALELFEQAIARDPSYVAARIHLATLLRERGDLNGAREQLEEALRWNRNVAETHRVLADILQQRGERDRAATHRNIAEQLQ